MQQPLFHKLKYIANESSATKKGRIFLLVPTPFHTRNFCFPFFPSQKLFFYSFLCQTIYHKFTVHFVFAFLVAGKKRLMFADEENPGQKMKDWIIVYAISCLLNTNRWVVLSIPINFRLQKIQNSTQTYRCPLGNWDAHRDMCARVSCLVHYANCSHLVRKNNRKVESFSVRSLTDFRFHFPMNYDDVRRKSREVVKQKQSTKRFVRLYCLEWEWVCVYVFTNWLRCCAQSAYG